MKEEISQQRCTIGAHWYTNNLPENRASKKKTHFRSKKWTRKNKMAIIPTISWACAKKKLREFIYHSWIFLKFNYSSSLSTSESRAKTPLPDSFECFFDPQRSFGNPLRTFRKYLASPVLEKSRCSFCYGAIFLHNTRGPLGCLLGFWPSGKLVFLLHTFKIKLSNATVAKSRHKCLLFLNVLG